MPIAYHFDPVLRLLHVQATGYITVAERAEFVATASVDQELPSKTSVLIDVSAILNAPNIDDVPKMARLVELLAERFQSRVAYFVTGVGIVTPYMLASEEVNEELAQARTFTNRSEAIKWLNAC